MFNQVYNANYFLLLFASLLIVGVVTTKFSTRFGVPALVLFLTLGMIAGSDVSGLIYFDDIHQAQFIGMLALVIIIFEGGLQTKWHTFRPVAAQALSLATVGVLITAMAVAVAARFILGVSWVEAFLFGSIVGSTDAAAVFSVMKGQNIKEKIAATLEAESGSNDPMAVFLTVSFIQLLTGDAPNFFVLIGMFFWQIGIGLFVGFVLGKAATYAINKINLDSSGLYPVFAMAFALVIYSVTSLVGASGLLAVYFAGLIIGNSELTYHHSIFRFNEGFAWMMQILMFIILGLLIFPTQLFTQEVVIKGLLLSGILMLIARPIAVFLSTIKMGFTSKELVLLSWAGLKGAVPIVLATFPMIAGLENSQLFFNLVFFVVLTSALIQGSTISLLAEKLGLMGLKKIHHPHSLELISIGKANAEMIECEANENISIIGQTLEEIDFPKDALVTGIIRGGDLVMPSGKTTIESGDTLYILTSKDSKKAVHNLLKTKRETLR
ncbi:MAG: potassium/proton antiporter [Clostridia bacterium]|nr:potassium/proton antiporter [Clostridia bacterium]